MLWSGKNDDSGTEEKSYFTMIFPPSPNHPNHHLETKYKLLPIVSEELMPS